MALPIIQSFAGIAAAEDLDAFDSRFTTIVGSFDGQTPSGGSLSTAGGGDHLAIITGETFDAAQYVQWRGGTGGVGGYNGGALRMSLSGDAYEIIDDGTTMFFNIMASAVFAGSLRASVAAPAAGVLRRFEFGVGGDPTAWRLLLAGVETYSGNDGTYGAGSAGLGGFQNGANGLTDYEAGNLAAGNIAGRLVSAIRLKSLIGGALA